MRIVLLTRYTPCQVFAINQLHRALSLDHVIFEGQPAVKATGLLSKAKQWWWDNHQMIKSPSKMWERYKLALEEKDHPCKSHHSISKASSQAIYQRLFHHEHDAINDTSLGVTWMPLKSFDVGQIRAMEPDVLLVFGTSILPQAIIDIPKLACLNLHWGLSPYYKGTHCTDWAIINQELEKVGVTVHLLDAGIDSGPIVKQARPKLEPYDCPFSLDMKLSILGADLLIDTVEKIAAGKTLLVKQQNDGIGKTYYNKHWAHLNKRELSNQLEEGLIGQAAIDRAQKKSIEIYEGGAVAGPEVYEFTGIFPEARNIAA